MNAGKRMEAQWKKFAERVDGLYFQRMNDGTATFYGGQAQDGIRFQQSSPYDCFMFLSPVLFLLELKSHKGSSLPNNAIRENQLDALGEASKKENICAGFVVDFPEKDKCFFAFGDDVKAYIESGERKSIPVTWFEEHGVELHAYTLKVNRAYNVQKFVEDLTEHEKTKQAIREDEW